MTGPRPVGTATPCAPDAQTIRAMTATDRRSPSSSRRRRVAMEAAARAAPWRARGAVRRIERVLRLAATPTFAVAALLAAFGGDGAMSAICGSGVPQTHASGMIAMYALMGVFHATPWLRLATSGRPPFVRTNLSHG